MKRYAEVIIDIALRRIDHPFTYLIPDDLLGKVGPGTVVTVPFGKASTPRRGYVTALKDHCDIPAERLKEISKIRDEDQDQTDDPDGLFAVRLAEWIRSSYGSTMAAALRTVLTAAGPGKPLITKQVRLLLGKEETERELETCVKKHQVAKERLLRELLLVPVQPYSLVTNKLHVSGRTVRSMEKSGVLAVEEVRKFRDPVSLTAAEGKELVHSPEQQAVIDSVLGDFRSGKSTVTLLHGITGSGKTEVYISIIREICAQGKQAIMLIPEISLTYQTLLRFYVHFGSRVSVVSSALSPGEKADQFERAKRGELDVMIGPRSALFTPFSNLGIIVIDEEHENSYKNEAMPKYHTRETAVKIAQMRGACVLLGSATPSMEAYHSALNGEYRLFRMRERLTGGMLPKVEITDMRTELREGNRSIFSRRLALMLEDRLSHGQQAMLFLNRRGLSGFVSCRACGYVFKCPHCDVTLSLHRGGRMLCHYCGYEMPAPRTCPECGSPYVLGMRAGTQQVEETVRKMFPSARVLRMDADTTGKKGSYEKILTAFANEEADILIGTQMIVKGHDFPNVTLVGILMADLSLYAPDYRAAERTFQLLTQAAGRAGRGSVPGEVVIQTYRPDHYSIQRAAAQDYEGFYREEITAREVMHYPPAAHMLAVQFQSENEDKAVSLAQEIRELLLTGHPDLTLIGPAAGAYVRLRDIYRFVLYIKDESYGTLRQCKDETEEYLEYQRGQGRDPQTQVLFDFDPVNIF